MEALQVVFKELYTSFLLRDFAGKIVPGSFLLFSYALFFCSPSDILKIATGRVSIVLVLWVAGLAWTVVLGLQSLAELTGIWQYYPVVSGAEMPAQLEIERFLRLACADERLQYERFVVIKEATGNLFIVGLLSTPAWIWLLIKLFNSMETREVLWSDWTTNSRTIIIISLMAIIMIGLFVMNREHVNKQYNLAIDTLKEIDGGKSHDCKKQSEN
jgi:hypothetical protein